jgi:hypothetical protein
VAQAHGAKVNDVVPPVVTIAAGLARRSAATLPAVERVDSEAGPEESDLHSASGWANAAFEARTPFGSRSPATRRARRPSAKTPVPFASAKARRKVRGMAVACLS